MTSSIPRGADFELSLRYLDGDLSEPDQIRFEIRLADDPELSAQFERLAALDMAQRRLGEIRASEAPPLAPAAMAPTVPNSAFRSATPLVAAGALALIGGGLAWSLLGDSLLGEYDNTNGSVRGADLANSATRPLQASNVLLIGFPATGPSVLLWPEAKDATPPAAPETTPPRYRLDAPSAIGQAFETLVLEKNFAWPVAAAEMSWVLVAQTPATQEEFLIELKERLRQPAQATRAALRSWLVNGRRLDVGEFRVGR